MLLTPHILAGAAVMTSIKNPILGLIFVLLSHYLLDLPPHAEYTINSIKNRQWSKSSADFLKAFLDMTLGMTIVFLTVGYNSLVLTAAFLAITPDGLTILHRIFPSNRLLENHDKIHSMINNAFSYKKIPAFWGIVSQLIVVGAAIFLLK